MRRYVHNISTERMPVPFGTRELLNLEGNLDDDLRHHEGTLSDRATIAWHAFLSSMVEWGILTFAEYRRIVWRLPDCPSDPVDQTLLGRAISYRHPVGEVTPAELDALASKMKADVESVDGPLPDRIAVAWHAYIAPLQVYGAITLGQYQSLRALLPKLEGEDPIDPIVLGRD